MATPANTPAHSDDQFEAICARHPDMLIEVNSRGRIIVRPPKWSLTGVRNVSISAHLDRWAQRSGTGLATASTAGFILPNGARRSASAAWTLKSRVAQLDPDSRRKFWRLCPDFVIELQADTDRPRLLREKMNEWIDNGAQLAWLIVPERRSVTIYRPSAPPETRAAIDTVAGEGPVAGFTLPLAFIWDPLEA